MTVRKSQSEDLVLPYEQRLLDSIFKYHSGDEARLDDYGELESGHNQLKRDVTNGLQNEGLFKRLSSSFSAGSINVGALLPLIVVFTGFSGISALSALINGATLFSLALLIPVVIAIIWARRKTKRGTRTATGRALTDQVIGFREYLSKAEADQLRFEEGQDIFSQYLPWAIVFGVADRWTNVCKQLIQMGRLPDTVPYWYYGPNFYDMMYLNSWSRMASSVQKASSPEPVQTDSSGFGGRLRILWWVLRWWRRWIKHE